MCLFAGRKSPLGWMGADPITPSHLWDRVPAEPARGCFGCLVWGCLSIQVLPGQSQPCVPAALALPGISHAPPALPGISPGIPLPGTVCLSVCLSVCLGISLAPPGLPPAPLTRVAPALFCLSVCLSGRHGWALLCPSDPRVCLSACLSV